jgi:hypothetical protein
LKVNAVQMCRMCSVREPSKLNYDLQASNGGVKEYLYLQHIVASIYLLHIIASVYLQHIVTKVIYSTLLRVLSEKKNHSYSSVAPD